jgi:peptidoglycan hydrolase-like protein with peptidoglycan-binding domain
MKIVVHIKRVIIAVFLVAASGSVVAEERMYGSFVYNSDIPNALFFMESIKDGDDFELRKALRNHEIDTLVLASPGGSVWAGLSMAGIIFDKKLRVFVPPDGICASACSFMFFGGSERLSKGELGVHQFASSDKKQKANAVKTQAQSQFTVSEIIGFLNEFDTPRFVLERMFQDREMYWFNEEETARLNSEEFTLEPMIGTAVSNYSSKKLNAAKVEEAQKPKYSTKELIALIQKRLNELGCTAGISDGVWGKQTNAAAMTFAKKANLPTSSGNLISKTFFDALVNAPSGFCPKPKPQPKTPKVKTPTAVITSVKSNIAYECTRGMLLVDGFVNLASAEEWFPKEAWIVYSSDGGSSASVYGISARRSNDAIKHGMSTIRNPGGETISIRHNNFNMKKSTLIIRLTTPGFEDALPTQYDCGPAEETNWWPN